MDGKGSGLRGFVAELGRRRVFRVAVVYALVALGVIEAAGVALPALQLPDWTTTLVVVLVLLGFPIALVLAWAFDITPQGVQRTEPLGEGQPQPRQPSMALATTSVVAVAAVAVFGGWFLLHNRATGSPGEGKIIAVLPFVNMSADPENEYFSDGITDDIITQLSKISGLRVVSRTSVTRYKGTTKSLREIGEELGVDAILEGGVRRANDRVRINAQLIDARSDEHLWAETYDRELKDIFAIQSDVAQQIASALEATLSPAEVESIESTPTENVAAYEYYLRGNDYLAGANGESDTDMAEEMFEMAITLDPDFTLASDMLSEAHASAYWGWRMQLGALGEGYLETLKELAPEHFGSDSASFYISKAILHSRENHQELARAHFDSAVRVLEVRLESGPAMSSSHAQLGLVYAGLGRGEDAVREGKVAVELLPLSKDAYTGAAWKENLAHIFVMLGEHDQAIDQLESLIAVASPVSIPWLLADPTWDPLRDHPRFRRLVEAER